MKLLGCRDTNRSQNLHRLLCQLVICDGFTVTLCVSEKRKCCYDFRFFFFSFLFVSLFFLGGLFVLSLLCREHPSSIYLSHRLVITLQIDQ